MKFGDALRLARQKSKYTMKQVVECAELSSEAVLVNYENHTVIPRLDTALKLSRLLGFPLDALDADACKPLLLADPNRKQLKVLREIDRAEKKLDLAKQRAKALGLLEPA